MEILLANPRGFCAGVNRAIEIVERALEIFGAPIYVRHEVVHNRYVVNGLREKGAIFVDELSEVPGHGTVIFSAHGVSKAVRREAEQRGLKVFDATCPLVTKVHKEVDRYQNTDSECILIGHAGHPEVEGTLGQYESSEQRMYLVESLADVDKLAVQNPDDLSYVTQTTLSVDDAAEIIAALRRRYSAIVGQKKNDICYATQNRQNAVKCLANRCDLLFVVGSTNSSNSNRLKELAERLGTKAYLIDAADQINTDWLTGVKVVGVTAGASAPQVLVEQVIETLRRNGGKSVVEIEGETENVEFSLPKILQPVCHR